MENSHNLDLLVDGTGNRIYVSIYNQVSDTPARGHSLWHGQWLCPQQGVASWAMRGQL